MVFTFLLEGKGNVPSADEGHVILRNMKTIRGNGRRQKENTYFHLEKKNAKKICKMKDVENRRHLTFILSCNTKIRKQPKLRQQM